ncbi:hypothetical protein NQZ68_020037 [Dissostichus eleginoides]|nr:hypothetical protein NQZ68_020037 [Dissostichus eleginoides]
MGSSPLSVTERSLRTLPFIPLLLLSLLWKWKIGPQAWVCAEELGGRAGTSDLSGLNKASLYPPPRSPHPNYTPDTSTILLNLLPFLTAPLQHHALPSSDHGSSFAQSPRGLYNIRLLMHSRSKQTRIWPAICFQPSHEASCHRCSLALSSTVHIHAHWGNARPDVIDSQ